jgi:TetR/AcrR family tetracycline transcriptional repressor
LDRAEIVATARQLLVDEGVDALTMRRLGEACGVRGPALYWHFKDKDELLGLIVESVTADLESGTDDQSWDERLVLLARSLRGLLVRHRGLAIVAAGGYTLAESALAGLDQLIGVLVGVGFTHREAVAIHYAILTFTTGFVTYETSSPLFRFVASAPGSPERLAGRERFQPLMNADYPSLAEAAKELDDITVDELFDRSIVALVQGFAGQLERSL